MRSAWLVLFILMTTPHALAVLIIERYLKPLYIRVRMNYDNLQIRYVCVVRIMSRAIIVYVSGKTPYVVEELAHFHDWFHTHSLFEIVMSSTWPNIHTRYDLKPTRLRAPLVNGCHGNPRLVDNPIFLLELNVFLWLYVNLDALPITGCITRRVGHGLHPSLQFELSLFHA